MGSPYGVFVYGVPGRTALEICRWYIEQLRRVGWSVEQPGENSLLARINGQSFVIRIATDTNQTRVSIAQLG
jgi:hypothetical protein